MKKPFKTLPALIVIITFLGIIGYLNFYKPQKMPIKTTATSSPAQGTTASPSQISGISEKEAIEKVRNLPEVQNYLKDVPNAKILLDHEEGNNFVVQVFEVKNGHTNTFNWYTIDKSTDKITPEFDFTEEN